MKLINIAKLVTVSFLTFSFVTSCSEDVSVLNNLKETKNISRVTPVKGNVKFPDNSTHPDPLLQREGDNSKVSQFPFISDKVNLGANGYRIKDLPEVTPTSVFAQIMTSTAISIIYPSNASISPNKTVATGLTDSEGNFSINPSDDFNPEDGEIFVLEASRRLGSSGKNVMTLRTYIKWDESILDWKSMTTPDIKINENTTALAIVEENTSEMLPGDTIGMIDVNGLPDSGIKGISKLTISKVADFVAESLDEQKDPFTFIKYIDGVYSTDKNLNESDFVVDKKLQTPNCITSSYVINNQDTNPVYSLYYKHNGINQTWSENLSGFFSPDDKTATYSDSLSTSIEFKFKGRNVQIYLVKGHSIGISNIKIYDVTDLNNPVKNINVDNYSPPNMWVTSMTTFTGLENNVEHLVVITGTGTKNPLADGIYYDFYKAIVHPDMECDISETNLYNFDFKDKNLTGADLTGFDLTRKNLSGTNFTGALLVKADLSNQDLRNTNLLGIDFTGANLENANLSTVGTTPKLISSIENRASFSNAYMDRINLTGSILRVGYFKNALITNAILDNANFEYAELAYASLKGSSVTGTKFGGSIPLGMETAGFFSDKADKNLAANLTGVDFGGATIKNVSFGGLEISSSNFSGATLNNVILAKANLSEANLSGLNLSGYKLNGTNFNKANLTGVNLTNTVLNSTKLTGANLTNADLTGEKLENLNLSGVVLTGANLTNVVLKGANLSGADLSGQNLSGKDFSDSNLEKAKLSRVDFRNVKINKKTILKGADFSGSNLGSLDLSNNDLSGINLTGATIKESETAKADFRGSNLSKAKWTNGHVCGEGSIGECK